jgi:hypothetical protein
MDTLDSKFLHYCRIRKVAAAVNLSPTCKTDTEDGIRPPTINELPASDPKTLVPFEYVQFGLYDRPYEW